MQPKFAAFLAVTDVDLTWSMGMDLGFRKERANTKYRPCSSLAFGAITNMDQDRFAVCLWPQRTAATVSNSSRCSLLPTGGSAGHDNEQAALV